MLVWTHTKLEQSLAMLSRWYRCENMQKTQLTSKVNKQGKLQMKYICKLHGDNTQKIYMRTVTPNQDNKIWFTCPFVDIIYSTWTRMSNTVWDSKWNTNKTSPGVDHSSPGSSIYNFLAKLYKFIMIFCIYNIKQSLLLVRYLRPRSYT